MQQPDDRGRAGDEPHRWGVPDVLGAQEDLLPQLDGDGLGSDGRAPNTMAAAEGRHHHQTTVRMFGD